jgi:hypothetical protein
MASPEIKHDQAPELHQSYVHDEKTFGRDDPEVDQPAVYAEKAGVVDYKADAIEAENAEHRMTVLQAVKAYPMASFWAFVMSCTIVSAASLAMTDSILNRTDHGVVRRLLDWQLRCLASFQAEVRSPRFRKRRICHRHEMAICTPDLRPAWCPDRSVLSWPTDKPHRLPLGNNHRSDVLECLHLVSPFQHFETS